MSRVKKTPKKSEEKKRKNNPKKKSKFKKRVLILLLMVLFVFAIKSAIAIHDWQKMALEMIANQPSQVLDLEGEIITEIGNERNRKNITFSEMPNDLKNAYVAIEDERFYKHFGVDIKRTTAAIGSYVIHLGNASFGASTITQQVVKNLTGDDANSPARKVKEWTKAAQLEWCMDKDKILESYLNIIYVGPNIYGVEMGAKYYFDKSASDLSLTESAFLAGINHAPNAYNPFNEEKNNTEKIKKRTKTVLSKMLELGNITEQDYNSAIAEVEKGLPFKNGKIEPEGNGVYSYHTDALLTEVISDLAQNKKISKTFATNYLYMANLKIESTQNSEIQKEIEDEFEKSKYALKSNNGDQTSQAAMVLMDHKTGYVLGCSGGLGEKKEARGFNRATQAIRQTGSSSKPLTVIIPALAEKVITPISTYDDELTIFIDYNQEEYTPINYNNYLGKITVRRAVESSQNIPFVKMMEELTPATSIRYLKKMGISTLNEKDENLALALGGLDKGISPLEMAGAYSAIANDGVYIEPTFYRKITNSQGKEVFLSKQEKRRAFSEEVAYVTKQLLTEPVVGNNGTATYCAIKGMDVAAKTGTTNEDYDRWLCGFTNYYTAVAWFGFDLSEPIRYNGNNPAGVIWSSVMTRVHKNLKNSEFLKAKNVISQKICKKSLKVANNACTDVFEEYFVKETVPEVCTIHTRNSVKNNTSNTTKEKKPKSQENTMDSVKNEMTKEPEKESINSIFVPEEMSNENSREEPEQNMVSVEKAEEVTNDVSEQKLDSEIENNSENESEVILNENRN